jgi:FkbM family methyltransferase
MGIAKNLLRFFLKRTGYELSVRQERLPVATLDNVKLALCLILRTHPRPVFVQVGAYDGQTDDPTATLLQSGKMTCVLVEPIERSFHQLTKMHGGKPNVHLVQAAVSHEDGEMTMYKVGAGTASDTIFSGGYASFDRAHLLKHKVKAEDIKTVTVPSISLKSLLARYELGEIDLLQIDTEGFDAEVVKMALQLETIPGCINFENIHLTLAAKAELYDLLTKKGYSFSHDKYNSLAVHEDVLKQWMTLPTAE